MRPAIFEFRRDYWEWVLTLFVACGFVAWLPIIGKYPHFKWQLCMIYHLIGVVGGSVLRTVYEFQEISLNRQVEHILQLMGSELKDQEKVRRKLKIVLKWGKCLHRRISIEKIEERPWDIEFLISWKEPTDSPHIRRNLIFRAMNSNRAEIWLPPEQLDDER